MVYAQKVSVILTSFNHAKYLRQSINSVLNQTYSNFELIIWDDASTDNSWDIIASYSDPRIRSFRNESNRYTTENLNQAISSIATGVYIAIHHSDDIWLPEKLEKQVAFLNEHPEVGAVFTKVEIINEDGQPFEDKAPNYYSIFDQPNRNRYEWLNHFFFHGNALCHPSVLIRKECYQDCGLYRLGLAQLPDFDMWIRICLKSEIHIFPERLVKFRIRANNQNSSADRSETRIRIQYEMLQILNNYRNVQNAKEFLRIFPSAKKYIFDDNADLDFILGKIAIESSEAPFVKLFGLNLFFEIFSDDLRKKRIEALYNFSQLEFLRLTGTLDVFSIELRRLPNLSENEKDKLIAEVKTVINSKAYRLALSLRSYKNLLLFGDPQGLISGNDNFRTQFAINTMNALRIIRYEGFFAFFLRFFIKVHLAPNAFVLKLNQYSRWIKANELNSTQLIQQKLNSTLLVNQPCISIVLVLENSDLKNVKRAISSVLGQTYENWELFVAIKLPISAELQEYLDSVIKRYVCVKIKLFGKEYPASDNLNSIIDLCSGTFIGFLNQNDSISPFALFEIVNRIQNLDSVEIIYTDEDKIDTRQRRFEPFFKPGFSPDFLRSINYMSHFLVMRKSYGDQIGWFRNGFDSDIYYDLVLRAVENTQNILHIPKVLYHLGTKVSRTSTSENNNQTSNQINTKALDEHFCRSGISASVKKGDFSNLHKVAYNISSAPLISIIIPNHDHSDDLKICVKSILEKSSYLNFEILIIENSSKKTATFEYYDEIRGNPKIRIVTWNQPFNYSLVNNWAVSQARGDILLFLNNDIEVVSNDWLEQMLQYAIRKDVGAVGAKLYYPDKTIQHGGVIVGLGGLAGHSHRFYPGNHPGQSYRLVTVQNLSAVTAACLMVRKSIFEEIKGFDENYILAYGDVDFCLRILQKGYLNVWTPYAELIHYESKTRGFDNTTQKIDRFNKEAAYFKHNWHEFLQKGDPYYNPNLTLYYEDFSIEPRQRIGSL